MEVLPQGVSCGGRGLASPWGTSPKWPVPATHLPLCRAGWPVRGRQDHGGEWAEPGEYHHGQRCEGADRQQPPAHDGEAHGPGARHQILQREDHMVSTPGPSPGLPPLHSPPHPTPAASSQARRGSGHRALCRTWLVWLLLSPPPLALETQGSQGLTLK